MYSLPYFPHFADLVWVGTTGVFQLQKILLCYLCTVMNNGHFDDISIIFLHGTMTEYSIIWLGRGKAGNHFR
jgi:hypothetical protein